MSLEHEPLSNQISYKISLHFDTLEPLAHHCVMIFGLETISYLQSQIP